MSNNTPNFKIYGKQFFSSVIGVFDSKTEWLDENCIDIHMKHLQHNRPEESIECVFVSL